MFDLCPNIESLICYYIPSIRLGKVKRLFVNEKQYFKFDISQYLPNLLSHCGYIRLTLEGLSTVSPMPNLQRFCIWKKSTIGVTLIEIIVTKFPNLRQIRLTNGFGHLSDKELKSLSSLSFLIKIILVHACIPTDEDNVTDAGVCQLIDTVQAPNSSRLGARGT